MKTTTKEITPQAAAKILETRNPNNRRLSDATIQKYANDMAAGNWCLTHQGIAFDTNGDLLDGQHRLAAIVKAKRPIAMLVTTGIPASFKNNGHTTSVFGAIDGLRPRTAATALDLLKYKNSTLVASMARCIAILATNSAKASVSGAMAEQIVIRAGGSIERIASISCGSKIVRIKTGGLAAIAFYHTKHPAQAEAFLIESQTVSGSPGSPSRAFAKWISNSANSGGNASFNTVYVACSALFHQAKGNKVEKLYGGDDAVRWMWQQNPQLKDAISKIFQA